MDSLKTPARPADIYLRFLNLMDALHTLPTLGPLDPLEERVLAVVARARQTQERLSVRDLMAQEQLGAPATIHARVTAMRKKGWLLADTDDSRRKQVDLTPAALAYFDELSGLMVKAAEGR